MKLRVILFTAFALIFSFGFAKADELMDLKEQLKILQDQSKAQQEQISNLTDKIQILEAKQEEQVKEVNKVPVLQQTVDKLKQGPASLLQGVTVGGDLKIAIFDRTQGKRNGVDEHNNGAAGFIGPDSPLRLTFSKELADWLRLDVRTLTEANASATPSLGSDISRTTVSGFDTDVELAYLTAALPKGYELKFGQIRPLFSEDYARETWWQELYNLPLKTCALQAWHDFGAELYKSFDFDKWSLPAYFYVLNGSHLDNSDSDVVHNNERKAILVHVAPEFFQGKLRFLTSFGYGKWDGKSKQDMFRTAYGFDWKYKKFNLRGEYIYNMFKNEIVPSGDIVPVADGVNKGYWIKAIYTFNPKWRAVLQESYSNLFQSGLTSTQTEMLSDKWYTTTFALDYSLLPNSTIIAQYDKGEGSRSDGSENLKYDRITMGWRTSF